MLLQTARSALFHLTVIENKYKRDAQYVEFSRGHRACFNVEFADADFTF